LTDKASSEAAPEPGTPEYDKQMAAEYDKAQNPDTSVEGSDAISKNATVPAERPEHIPEKFWDAEKGEARYEELAKSYAELEAKLAGKDKDKADDKDQSDEPSDDADKAKETLEAKGVTEEEFNEWTETFQKEGKVTEEIYERLEGLGFSRTTVDAYIEGQQARQELYENKMFSEAGMTKDQFQTYTEWAATNWKEGLDQYHEQLETDTVGALKSLKEAYVSANGEEPSNPLTGDGYGQTSGGYESQAQIERDMSSDEYKKDPAFRAKVQQKLARTPEDIVFGT